MWRGSKRNPRRNFCEVGASGIFDVELFSRYLDARRRAGQDGREGIYELPLDEWADVGGSKVRPHHFLQAAVDLGRIVAASKRSQRQLGPGGE
jgi:hypothetical protein